MQNYNTAFYWDFPFIVLFVFNEICDFPSLQSIGEK